MGMLLKCCNSPVLNLPILAFGLPNSRKASPWAQPLHSGFDHSDNALPISGGDIQTTGLQTIAR